MSFALRANRPSFVFQATLFNQVPSTVEMTCCLPAQTVGLHVYLLVFSNRHFGCMAVAPTTLVPHRWPGTYPFGHLLDLLLTLLITEGVLRHIGNTSGIT